MQVHLNFSCRDAQVTKLYDEMSQEGYMQPQLSGILRERSSRVIKSKE